MARGVASPAPNALPKVSFVKIIEDGTQQAAGVGDQVARSYGYNGPSVFQQEKHYIRYIEPLESDLAVQVEYDMDEQDQEWVDALNGERKAQQLDKVTYETFEIVMDRLEKEWFDLTKNIPKSDIALPSEDSTCAICDDSEGENANAIVFCDGCNLAVHQDCYGVPYIPEGQWLCRKCTVSPENPVSCILCPKEGGAFKQTVSGDWVHLLCAIWVPETAVANDVFMEPITGVEKISKQRWRLRCSVCDEKHGACIQCTKASCFTAFHATCARKEKFLMPMKATQGSEAPVLACYCEKHLPPEQLKVREAALQAQSDDGDEVDGHHQTAKSSKSARAYNKTYKPGPPLVPKIIVNRILHYISRIPVRHKQEFIHLVCRYWSLKREARRGAPLLKRLHLEPWTALSGSKQQTDQEKAEKLDLMKGLRDDLEKLRIIADVVRKRERVKQAQAEAVQGVLLDYLFPHEGPLRLAFQRITAHDRQNGYFKTPVNKAEVPDYYDVIKNPMCWDTIDQKLDRHEYLDLAEFKRDINLVLDNATTYNEPSTPYYKTAVRIRNAAQAPLAELDVLVHHPVAAVPDAEPPADGKVEELESAPTRLDADVPMPLIGDLEPPLEMLNLLMSEESVRNDTNLILTSTPIESLLNFELPLIRPHAPPLPPVKRFVSNPALHELKRRRREKEREMEKEREREKEKEKEEKAKQKKPRYDRSAAIKRKREERLAALDASPGFRSTRTRAAAAAAAVFEAESARTSETPEESSVAGDQPMTEAGPSTAPPEKPKRQRKSMATSAQDMPPTVDDVDNWQSFKMFEVGWILPPDQKRGGRVGAERGPVPPPRKRAKTSHEKSRLSEVSAAPTDEQVVHSPAKQASLEPDVSETSAHISSEPRETARSHVETALPEPSPSEPLPPERPPSEAPEVVMAQPPVCASPKHSVSPSPPEIEPGLVQEPSPPPASPAPSEPISVDARPTPQLSSPPSLSPQPEAEPSTASEPGNVPEPPTTEAEVTGPPFDVVDEDMEIDVVTVSSPALPPSTSQPGVPEPPEIVMPPSSPEHELELEREPETVPDVEPQAAPERELTPASELEPERVLESITAASPARSVAEETTGSDLKESLEVPEEIVEVAGEAMDMYEEPPSRPPKRKAPEPDPDETEDEFIDAEHPPKPPTPSPPPEPRRVEGSPHVVTSPIVEPEPMDVDMPEPIQVDVPEEVEIAELEHIDIEVREPDHVEVHEPERIDVEEEEPHEAGGPTSPEAAAASPRLATPERAGSLGAPSPAPAHPEHMSPVSEHPAASPAPPAQTESEPEPEPEPAPEPAPETAPEPESAPEPEPEPEPEPDREMESESKAEEAPEEAPTTAAAEEPQSAQQPEEEMGEKAKEKEKEKDTKPVKVIWINVIETPAIRREKAKQKRLEREARKRAEAEAAAAALAPSTPVAGPSRLDEVAMDVDSDLTDLDEDETEDDENVPAPAPPPPPPPPPRVEPPKRTEPPEPGMIVLAEGEKLEGGTLVWAKTASFPYWPAVVFEEDSLEVPKNVLETAPPNSPPNGGNAYALVRFYEKKTTRRSNHWAWVKLSNMRYLGEDSSLDAAMLAPTSKYQKWRSAIKRTECRNAFQDALAEMEGEEDLLAYAPADAPPPPPGEASAGQPAAAKATEGGEAPAPAEPTSESMTIEAAMGADSPMTEVE